MGMLKQFALVVGAILTLVGVVGFFVGDSVLGFGVNAPHNIVHLVSGLWLLFAALGGKEQMLKLAAQVLGVVYLVVGVLGLLGVGFIMGLLNMNMADTILHLVLGVVLAYFGFVAKK